MATFHQWLTHYADAGVVKKSTWVCGDEWILVEQVLDFIKRQLAVSEMDHESFVAGSDPEKTIWAALNQYPFDGAARRLVVVRSAQKLKGWPKLEAWLDDSRLLPNNFVVFVADQPDFYVYDDKGKRTAELYPGPAAIKSKGHLVRCSTPTPDQQVEWVRRQARTSEMTAKYLLDRCFGDLAAVRNACRKANLFKGDMSPGVVDILVSENVRGEFVHNLLKLNKPKALAALEGVAGEDYASMIGLLEYNLRQLGKLYAALRDRKTKQELLRAASPTADGGKQSEIGYYTIENYYEVAKHYDPARRAACFRTLTAIDDSIRLGSTRTVAHDGSLQALVALW